MWMCDLRIHKVQYVCSIKTVHMWHIYEALQNLCGDIFSMYQIAMDLPVEW